MVARLMRKQLLYDGCYAHVISRSNRKQWIFKDDKDFIVFCDLLKRLKSDSKFRIFHYCLMHTHFHLAVMINEVNLFSKAMQRLKSLYTYHFHDKYKISGPIWRERYRSLIVENEAYLYACGKYIENNPLRAGLVGNLKDWKYSSYNHYFGKKNELVDGYLEKYLPELPEGLDSFDEAYFENERVIGSGYFQYKINERRKTLG